MMMRIRRFSAVCVALLLSAALVEAQRGGGADNKNQPKRSKEEQKEIETVVKLVDGVMAGTTPAPTDVTMTIEPFFMKSQESRTFVPFVLTVTNAPQADAAMYVRVVNPSAVPDPKAKTVQYPWDD